MQNSSVPDIQRTFQEICSDRAQSVLDQLGETVEGQDKRLLADLARNVTSFEAAATENQERTSAMVKSLQDGQMPGKNYIGNYVVQVFVKYRLLNTISDVLGFKDSMPLAGPRKNYAPKLAERFAHVVVENTPWYSGMLSIETELQKTTDQIDISDLFASSLPEELSEEQSTYCQSVFMIADAHTKFEKAKLVNVLGNMSLLAFMVRWYATHNTPFPSTDVNFFASLISSAEQSKLPRLSDKTLRAFNGTEGTLIHRALCAVIDLAVMVSPLTMLHPITFARMQFTRKNVLEWSQTLGPKPENLIAAENLFWKSIINISLGADSRDELKKFIENSREIADNGRQSSMEEKLYFFHGTFGEREKAQAQARIQGAIGPVDEGGDSDIEMDDANLDVGAAAKTSSTKKRKEPDTTGPPAAPTRESTRIKTANPKYAATTAAATATRSSGSPRKRSKPGVAKSEAMAETEEDLGDRFLTAHFGYWDAINAEIVPEVNRNVRAKVTRISAPAYVAPEMSATTLTMETYDGWPDHPATSYEFKPDAASAVFDIPLLSSLMSSVKRGYVDGLPPHRRPEARNIEYTGGTQSRIFVVDFKDFTNMEPAILQRIHRDRHILVINVEQGRQVKFDERGLGMLAPLDQPVQFQVAHKKNAFDPTAMLTDGTLQDMLDNVRTNKGIVMNCLDLPLGGQAVEVPPMFTDIATETHSLPIVKNLVRVTDLSDDLVWGTVATMHANSWPHTDDEGFGTTVMVLVGGKNWILADTRLALTDRDDMAHIGAYGTLGVNTFEETEWTHEAVHLTPRCVLFQRPCTSHAVVGTGHSIVLGRHYYPGGGLRRACWGVVHTFVLNLAVTNTEHHSTKPLFHRIMALCYRHYIALQGFKGAKDPHVPDLTTAEGLLDFVALGCILEFSTALNRYRYSADYKPEEDVDELFEEETARHRFRLIMKTFGENFTTSLGPYYLVHPSYVWKRIMVLFAAAVVTYRNQRDSVIPDQTMIGIDKYTIAAAFRAHLAADHLDLVPCFDRDVAKGVTSLTWTGPDIIIARRSASAAPLQAAMGIGELPDWQALPGPLYIDGDEQGEFKLVWTDDEEDEEEA